MWTDHGNILIAYRHINVEIGTEAPAIPFLGIHKWDFRGSVGYNTPVSGPVVYAPWLLATIRLTFTADEI
jgi:hypothetical protein